MSNIVGKIWGNTSILYSSPLIEVHTLDILPNSYCSLHRHDGQCNSFYVCDGVLYIEIHKKDYALIDTTILRKDDFTTAPPGEDHRFYTKEEGAKVLEIYHLEPLNRKDIIRKDHGGTGSI